MGTALGQAGMRQFLADTAQVVIPAQSGMTSDK